MEVDCGSARLLDAHRFVAIFVGEQVAMIGRENRVLDAGLGEPAQCPDEVVDNGIHHHPSLMGHSTFTGGVDLLRAHDDYLGTADMCGQLRL